MMNGTEPRNMIPLIKRTRDYHLYDFKGGRLLDMYLDGGRALMGHKHGRAILMMKNSLDKGMAASYPGVWEGRLLKQLKLLYPEVEKVSVVFAGPADKAQSEYGKYRLYRPFEYESPVSDKGFSDEPFELMLPLPGSGTVRVICSLESCAGQLPTSDPVPQYLYSGLCRAAADLKAFGEDMNPAVWAAFDSPLWKRRGPWLFPMVSADDYDALFKAFLARGMLLSPDPEVPSCAPYRFTEGEIKPIKEIEGEFDVH